MLGDPLLRRELAGFRIEALIGKGGMGRVYRATQLSLNRTVAVKVLTSELAENKDFRSRFLHESHLAGSIEHPNILPIFDAGECEGQLFIAMRLVEGTSPDLGSLLAREGPLAPERVLRVLEQAASALDAAHAEGLVHRDVKPGNLLLAGDHVYLTDFGVAKPAMARRDLTRTGVFIGTLDYASPEQIHNEPLDGRSDLYALGAVLYQCLTGAVPFDRPSEYAVMQAHLSDPPPLVSDRRPDLPAALDHIIATAMAKAPDERYRNGRKMAEATRAALEGRLALRPTVAQPLAAVTPTVIQGVPTSAELPSTEAEVVRGGALSSRFAAAALILALLGGGAVVAGSFAGSTATPPPTQTPGSGNVVFPLPSASVNSTAAAAPIGPPTIILLGCTSPVRTNEAVNCSPRINGTTPATKYSWLAPDGSPTSGIGSTFSTSFSAPGGLSIGLQVCNDGACNGASQLISVTPPTTQAPTLAPTPQPTPAPTPNAGPNRTPAPSVSSSGLVISGTVTDFDTGAPIYQACVTLGPPIRCFTTTDPNGRYVINLSQLGASPGTVWDMYFLKSGQYGQVYSGPFVVNGPVRQDAQLRRLRSEPLRTPTPTPPRAAIGFDSAYAGESAFLTMSPGQTGTFTVFFANTGTIGWVKGTATQVDLATCLEDKVTCNAQDPAEARFNTGWLSATRYTTHTQSSVSPGSIATFTFNVSVAIGQPAGTYRFNGTLVVSSTGADVHNEGYYQDVTVR